MKSKRTLSVILSAVMVGAGANMFVSNAASVQPDINSITSESSVGATAAEKELQAQIKSLEKKIGQLQEELYYQEDILNRTKYEYEEQIEHIRYQNEDEINSLYQKMEEEKYCSLVLI